MPSPATKASPQVTAGGLFASPEKRNTVLSLLLVVVTLALYNPVVSHPFVNYDDDRYVTANAHVQQGFSGETIRWALTSTEQANWHPLTWISHSLDYSLFHFNPAGHHFTNLLIHAANAALLFLLLVWGTGCTWPSLLVALLFAVHPVNVESVAWVAERKNVLSTLFFFLSIGAYGWYAKRPTVGRYLWVVVLFACGLASKPMVITLPFVLLLLDYWPLARIRGMTAEGEVPQKSVTKLMVEKTPLLLMSVASAVITIVAQTSGGAMRSSLEFSFPVRLANAIHAYAMYLWNTVWPLKLAPLYPHPGNSLSTSQIAVSALVVIGISIFIARARQRRYLVVGWLWFLGTLVPVLGLVQVGDQAMADRYAYIPLIGIFVMIAFGAAELVRSTNESSRAKGTAFASVAAIVVILLAVATREQLGYWANNEGLWRRTIAVTEKNFIAEDNLGGALLLTGNSDEAVQHFLIASEINPRDPMSRGNIGAYLLEKGQYGRAIDQLKTVPELTSDAGLVASADANLGTAYRNFGDQLKARQSYEEALRINPNQANAWLGLGLLLEQEGDLQQAAVDMARAAEIQPDPQTYFLLGRTMARLNRTAEARVAFENALKLQPEFVEAQRALDALGR